MASAGSPIAPSPFPKMTPSPTEPSSSVPPIPFLREGSSAAPDREQSADVGPVRDHPVEVAARNGFGPLSGRAKEVWHGDSAPCVTCGQLVSRSALSCTHCAQDLHPMMIERMRAHAGPWYVFEHVRPFPGVNLERIIRQIHRGLITETSIVRGPNTDYQWRYAVETPGLSIYFLRCWRCHAEIAPTYAFCPKCHSHLYFDVPVAPTIGDDGAMRPPFPPPTPVQFGESASPYDDPSLPPPERADHDEATPELDALRSAIAAAPQLAAPPLKASATRQGSTSYGIIVGLLIAATVLFLTIVQLRSSALQSPPPTTATPPRPTPTTKSPSSLPP